MGRKLKLLKPVTTEEENKEYLRRIFAMLKKTEGLMDLEANHGLNTTELRLVSEIVLAEVEGYRLISTQLAKKLGVTRSAVSQMVNKLEKDGIIVREADDVDKKIAYVVLTDWAKAHFQDDLKIYAEFVSQLVARFGVARLEKLFALMDEFVETASLLKAVVR